MDVKNGGSGLVEFIPMVPTPEEIKRLGGGYIVKVRMVSNSLKKNHYEAIDQYTKTFKEFMAMTGSIEFAEKKANELHGDPSERQLLPGVIGYGKATSAPNGWTLHDKAMKLAMKNLIKFNFQMPGRTDWPLITGGTIGAMSESEYTQFLLKHGEFLEYKNVGNDELNKLALADKSNSESDEKISRMTESEQRKYFAERVEELRGKERDDEIN